MKNKLKILLLEDEVLDAELIQKSLQRAGIEFTSALASDKAEFLAAIQGTTFDIILADNSLPQFNSFDALKLLHQQHLDIPFILVTGTVSEEFAVNIIHEGADDYILKNNLTRLPSAIGRAIEKRKIRLDKQAAEAALIKSERRYRTLFQRNLAGIYQSTIEGKIIECNNAFCKMLGYSTRTEIQEVSSRELYFSESDRKQLISRLLYEKYLFNYESVMRKKDGETLYVIENISLQEANDNGDTIIEGIMINISDRKKGEEALRTSEKKYRVLFDENPLPAWVLDKATNICLAVNAAAIRHYGYSHEEFLNMNIKTIQRRNIQNEPSENLAGKKPGGLSRLVEHFTKDGTKLVAEIASSVISYENKPARLVLANDLTQKLQAQNEIKKINLELHDLSCHLQNIREEERIQIARDIHDELGQQLTGLKMDVHALGKVLKPENENIKGKFTDILLMIDELVKSVRRISANLRPSILDDLGLVAALEWHSKEVQTRFGIKVNFVSKVHELDIPPGACTGLFRIYQEVLTNAVRHAEAKTVESSLRIVDARIILDIRDDGKGIDLNSSKKKKSFGLLGMKERVFVLNGTYELKSKPGEGTSLHVSLPC
ncbi:MAG TPA: PAS domain S-box protein [Puia sp.]|nr:PAS domain S-box protein [Puia sp.]